MYEPRIKAITKWKSFANNDPEESDRRKAFGAEHRKAVDYVMCRQPEVKEKPEFFDRDPRAAPDRPLC